MISGLNSTGHEIGGTIGIAIFSTIAAGTGILAGPHAPQESPTRSSQPRSSPRRQPGRAAVLRGHATSCRAEVEPAGDAGTLIRGEPRFAKRFHTVEHMSPALCERPRRRGLLCLWPERSKPRRSGRGERGGRGCRRRRRRRRHRSRSAVVDVVVVAVGAAVVVVEVVVVLGAAVVVVGAGAVIVVGGVVAVVVDEPAPPWSWSTSRWSGSSSSWRRSWSSRRSSPARRSASWPRPPSSVRSRWSPAPCLVARGGGSRRDRRIAAIAREDLEDARPHSEQQGVDLLRRELRDPLACLLDLRLQPRQVGEGARARLPRQRRDELDGDRMGDACVAAVAQGDGGVRGLDDV